MAALDFVPCRKGLVDTIFDSQVGAKPFFVLEKPLRTWNRGSAAM